MDARPAARRGGDGFRRDRPPHRRRPAARTGGARAPVPALRRRRRGPPRPARVHAAGRGDDRRRPDLRARFPHRAVGSPWRPAAAPRGGDTGPRPGPAAHGPGPQRLVLRPRLRAGPPGRRRPAGAAGSRAAPDGRPDRTARRDGAGPRRRRGDRRALAGRGRARAVAPGRARRRRRPTRRRGRLLVVRPRAVGRPGAARAAPPATTTGRLRGSVRCWTASSSDAARRCSRLPDVHPPRIAAPVHLPRSTTMSFSTPAARTVAAGILTLVTSLGVTGCGSDTSSAAAPAATPAARPRPRTRPRRSSTSPSRARRSRRPTSGSR